jgi:S-methylmethionine-dependent homocysteine/selenocysteine methylase
MFAKCSAPSRAFFNCGHPHNAAALLRLLRKTVHRTVFSVVTVLKEIISIWNKFLSYTLHLAGCFFNCGHPHNAAALLRLLRKTVHRTVFSRRNSSPKDNSYLEQILIIHSASCRVFFQLHRCSANKTNSSIGAVLLLRRE